MRRVAVTGLGIVSSIGNDAGEVAQSLREQRSGLDFAPDQAEKGFRSQVHGRPKLDAETAMHRKERRFMAEGGVWNCVAMAEAIADSGLGEDEVSHPLTGLIMGQGGGSTKTIFTAASTGAEKGVRRVSPFAAPKAMSSGHAAALTVHFGIQGMAYAISSACATSAHCIGHGADLIRWGRQDVVFAGGGEELDWTLSIVFDAMGAMSSHFNQTPPAASRPFDKERDGFVIAGGAGVLVLEEMERAKKRGAKIYGELTGYGSCSSGEDMVRTSRSGAARAMQAALAEAGKSVEYINAHATSTPQGDPAEIEAIAKVFPSGAPPVSASKSLTGHSLGAAGAQEAIYSLIMLKEGFLAGSANIAELDEACAHAPILRENCDAKNLTHVMSNSFGFGGTYASLIFAKL